MEELNTQPVMEFTKMADLTEKTMLL